MPLKRTALLKKIPVSSGFQVVFRGYMNSCIGLSLAATAKWMMVQLPITSFRTSKTSQVEDRMAYEGKAYHIHELAEVVLLGDRLHVCACRIGGVCGVPVSSPFILLAHCLH
jgi:hypothetical protein